MLSLLELYYPSLSILESYCLSLPLYASPCLVLSLLFIFYFIVIYICYRPSNVDATNNSLPLSHPNNPYLPPSQSASRPLDPLHSPASISSNSSPKTPLNVPIAPSDFL